MTAAFLGLEAALYAVFLTMDLTGGSGDPVKYASIAVCLVFSVLFACRGGSRLMAAAMALTLGADTFLLLLNDHYGAGVALFCGVQALYLVRICRRNGGRTLWPLRLVLVLGAWAGLWALGLLSPLNLLAGVLYEFPAERLSGGAPSQSAVFRGTVAVSAVRRVRGDPQSAGAVSRVACRLCPGGHVAVLPAGSGASGAVRPKGANEMKKFLSVLTIPLTALAVLTGAIALPLLVRPFYWAQIQALDIPARSGLTVEQLRDAFGDVMDYCLGLRPDFAAGVLPFSQEGASHFADVRVLFLLDIRLLAVSLAALLALYLLRRRKGMALCRFGGRGPGFWAACGLGGLFVIVGGLAALDFDRAFTVFHTIFFPGKDNWLFDPMTDPVILILPEEFFRSCALLILAGLLLACGALIAADLRHRRR